MLRVLSLNCTNLTRARLESILHHAHTQSCHMIMLQETRHHTEDVPWASRLAKTHGWNTLFSKPPPLNSSGVRRQGGTAVLWLPTLGKAIGSKNDDLTNNHRACIVTFPNFVVASAYGPAKQCDINWFSNLLFHCSVTCKPNQRIVGDFNWGPTYDKLLPPEWYFAEPSHTTHAGTSPTRAIATTSVSQISASPLPGIPTHFAVTYQMHWPNQVQQQPQTQRLRRCQTCQWLAENLSKVELEKILEIVNIELPKPDAKCSLVSSWRRWHARAERAVELAASHGFATKLSKAERPKGSFPTSRPCAHGACHRAPQSVLHRRLLRIHRVCTELVRQGTCSCDILPPQVHHRLTGVLHSAGVSPAASYTLNSAFLLIDSLIQQQEQLFSEQNQKAWRAKFKTFSLETWKPAKALLKPPALATNFSAADMRTDWSTHWCPNGNPKAAAEQWNKLAAEAEYHCPQWQTEQKLPSRKEFWMATLEASGSAGFDGWTATEVLALQKHLTPLADELYELWCATTEFCHNNPEPCPELSALLWSWKVVGIPKKVPSESRPISVASILVRVWHKALLKVLPPPPADQWCGKAKTSVVHATASFFAFEPEHIAETDLSKAFDHLWPEVALTALQSLGANPKILATLNHAWRAPRICVVGSEMATPIIPLRGIPQGDPISPLGLSACIGPWSAGVKLISPFISTWAYMDDRTIGVSTFGNNHHLQAALDYTNNFDNAVGFEVNPDKTQIWSISNPQDSQKEMEHLGLKYNPNKSTSPVEARDSQKLDLCVQKLSRCPGSISTRGRLATAFIKPLQDWASPLMSPGSLQAARELFRAITNASSSWWCQARFWAQHVDLHPRYGVAIRGLCNASQLLQHCSSRLTHSIQSLCKILKLQYLRCTQDSIFVRTSDETVKCGKVFGDHPGDFSSETRIDKSCDQTNIPHALRIRARKLLLLLVKPRFDSEGISDVDLEIFSHPLWKRFVKNLTPTDKNILTIWLSGAIWTPTRRFYQREPKNGQHCSCFFCEEPHASAKHFFVNCPKFEKLRLQLQVQFNVPSSWWEKQPRCTSKSGWITFDSCSDLDSRVSHAIAANTLGIHIANIVFEEKTRLGL